MQHYRQRGQAWTTNDMSVSAMGAMGVSQLSELLLWRRAAQTLHLREVLNVQIHPCSGVQQFNTDTVSDSQ